MELSMSEFYFIIAREKKEELPTVEGFTKIDISPKFLAYTQAGVVFADDMNDATKFNTREKCTQVLIDILSRKSYTKIVQDSYLDSSMAVYHVLPVPKFLFGVDPDLISIR